MTVFNVAATPKNEILEGMKAWLSESLGDSFDIMLPELAEMYIEDGPALLSDIKNAIAQQDATALKNSAHALKGCSSSLGLSILAKHCQVVESSSATADFAMASSKMSELEAEFNQVISVFEGLI